MSLAFFDLDNSSQATALAQAALQIYEQIKDPNARKIKQKLSEWNSQIEGKSNL